MNPLATMDCDATARKLSAHHDGELPAVEDAAVSRHLEQCGDCRQRLASLADVSALITVPELPNDPFFVTRFRARVRDRSAAETEWARRLVLRLLMPIAASALVVALALVLLGDADGASFTDLERQALSSGSQGWVVAPEASDFEELVAATLGPRAGERPERTVLSAR